MAGNSSQWQKLTCPVVPGPSDKAVKQRVDLFQKAGTNPCPRLHFSCSTHDWRLEDVGPAGQKPTLCDVEAEVEAPFF